MKKKVVIIGAGPAGLTTALYLLQNSNKYDVTIIEKNNIIGGISKSVNMNGCIVDTGIHRFFSKNDLINDIWKSILPIQSMPAYDDIIYNKNRVFPSAGSDPEKDDNVFLIKERKTRIFYKNKYFDYPVSLNLKTIINMGFIDTIKCGCSYIKSLIFKLPETSLENFYINRFGKKLYSMFFEDYTEKVWGIHPKNISPDWGAQRVKGISILEILKDFFRKMFKIKNKNNTETSLIEEFYYPKLGSGEMYEKMADKIKELGGNIYLNSSIEKINIKNNDVKSIDVIINGVKENIKTNYFISSIPIKDLFKLFYGIKIPKKIYNSAINLPYREFISVALLVDKFNMVEPNGSLIKDSWLYIQEPCVKMGRMQIFNNWSPYLFKRKEDIKDKVMFSIEYFCNENDEFWNMKEKDMIDFAISEAIKINAIDNHTKIYESKEIKIKKAYPAYFGTYEDMDKIIKFLNKIDNLYCVGRNGQHRYNNMDHSMLTGIEAANSIMFNTDKKILWNVNTEKEYHEIKK